MRILITGSNGFVGGAFGRYASRAGHEVIGVGRASQASRGWLGTYAQADAVSADLSPLVRDFAPDLLFHAAGTASVRASLDAPLQDLRASVLSFANALEAVRRSGATTLVLFPSSAAVYGDPAQLPVGEDAHARPISPYGFHKAACELVAREYSDCFRLRVAVCRLFSVFGAAQRRLLVWELYQQFAGAGETVWLEGTGEETRDYLHIDDVSTALLALAETQLAAPPATSASFLTVNVASGAATRVISLAEQLRALVAPSKEIRTRGAARPGDPRAWRADISRLRALAPKWQPAPLTDSLARCVAEWREETHDI
ncbi:MAG: UDP-glucose 4-epimerase [Acidobacteriota bacterium]|nr:UDP-glucose 4-epimerase [Acidobacteriota bacterium]